jgi:serine/threonine-protein kinase
VEEAKASAVPGTRLGRYTLLGKLATGGMAEVFLARQDGPQGFAKTVVIKKILPHFGSDQQFVQMFLNEARLAAIINHPNVVSIYELGEDAATDTYYMVMEYIDGCNLKRLSQAAHEQHRALSPGIAARLLADAAAGLDFAHSLKGEGQVPLNIVHRDVSPENILITYSGLVKVVDFGIAKAAYSESKTRTGQLKGKIGYMSPEQVLGHPIDRRTDVWALGVTLYWMLGGQKPFRGENEAQVIHQILSVEPAPLPDSVPRELQRIIAKTLAKNADERYATGAALQADLERYLALSGQAVNASACAAYMNELFPEASDPDRLLTRAILSGQLRQMLGQQPTPSRTATGAGAGTAPGSLAKTVTSGSGAKPKQSWRTALIAAPLLLLPIGGVGAYIWYQSQRSEGAPPLAQPVPAPVATATAPAPAPAPAPAAPPVKAPALAAVRPDPAPALDLRAPASPAPASSRKHRPSPGQRPTAAEQPPSPAPAPVAAPAPTPAPEPHGPPGLLAIRVLPWASVFVDGRMVGTTPFEPISVASGRHRVELVNDELHVKRNLTVEVKAGETATVQEKLE